MRAASCVSVCHGDVCCCCTHELHVCGDGERDIAREHCACMYVHSVFRFVTCSHLCVCHAVAHVDAALPEEVANILAGGGGGGGGDASTPSPAPAPLVPAATTDPATATDAQGQATDVVKSEEGVGAAAPAVPPAATHDAAVTAVGGYSPMEAGCCCGPSCALSAEKPCTFCRVRRLRTARAGVGRRGVGLRARWLL